MSRETLNLTIRQHGPFRWVLSINGTPYALGMQAYCVMVARDVRLAFNRYGWAAFPDIPRKELRHD